MGKVAGAEHFNDATSAEDEGPVSGLQCGWQALADYHERCGGRRAEPGQRNPHRVIVEPVERRRAVHDRPGPQGNHASCIDEMPIVLGEGGCPRA